MVDFYCELLESEGAQPFQTVRGCFPEGEPIFGRCALGRGEVRESRVRRVQ
jgi:hypothetical protein